MNSTILLTFDVEDWFQVENFKQCIPFSSWPTCELRVEKNVHRILDLLDSIKPHNPTNPSNAINPESSRFTPHDCVKATFFVLGWIAERIPYLVREIQVRGHEVASHGYYHVPCRGQWAGDLKNDLVKSKKLLEDITGSPINGYRAPGFSINHDILNLIEGAGYLYDSSYNSFGLNKRYGKIELNENGNSILHKMSESFYELPISNLKIGGKIVPWGGGGYFRLIPNQVFKYGVQAILGEQGAYLFYLHPWEIDSNQPKVTGVRISYKFRHYINLGKTINKLSYFLDELRDCRFQTCYEYLMDKNRSTAAPQHFLTQ